MKVFLSLLFVSLTLCLSTSAQTASTPTPPGTAATADAKPKRQIFRATKDQIKQVQAMLKDTKLYTGEATGTLNDATRASIKVFQNANGLKDTGTLNRATLEKMNVDLTETQKAIPVSESSYASADTKASSTETKPKRTIFRATKEQIMEAQKLLKAKALYSGEETGKLDDATRDGLRKFQHANDVKVTGTLNQVTLEKMGIALTDKQKAASAGNK